MNTFPEPQQADQDGHEQGAYHLFQQGSVLLAQGHPGAAAVLLERAKRLEPAKTSIREALGRAYFALRDYERAGEEFDVIVAAVPVNDYAHYALARTLLKRDRRDEALSHLRLASALAPACARYREALAAAERT